MYSFLQRAYSKIWKKTLHISLFICVYMCATEQQTRAFLFVYVEACGTDKPRNSCLCHFCAEFVSLFLLYSIIKEVCVCVRVCSGVEAILRFLVRFM